MSKKDLPSWTVQKMSDDPEIINALIPMITPSKDQTSDAIVKDTNVSQPALMHSLSLGEFTICGIPHAPPEGVSSMYRCFEIDVSDIFNVIACIVSTDTRRHDVGVGVSSDNHLNKTKLENSSQARMDGLQRL
nr:hypothetical protein [Tanacetum cinerariifolium]